MKLRSWQKKAFPIWWKYKRGILKVVTGGGKTFFAVYCLKEFIKTFPDHKILIVVPSIPLLDQWSIEISNTFGSIVSKNGGGEKINKLNHINITTSGSLGNISNKFNPKKTLLIFDECHKLGTARLGSLLDKEWHSSMGLSATPEREFDEYFDKIIVKILGNIIYDYDYVNAYKDGVISSFSLLNAYAPMLEDEDRDYDHLSKQISKRIAILGGIDNTDERLKLLLFKRARLVGNSFNRIPLAIKLIKKYKGHRWIVFSETKAQAALFNNILNKNGFRSSIYNTDISHVYRTRNLYEFKEGIIDTLVTCRSLDEGFDFPEIDGAIILSSSSTSRQRIQRMGRALRKAKGKKKALIITLYSSDSEFLRLRDESKKYKKEDIDVEWIKLNLKK